METSETIFLDTLPKWIVIMGQSGSGKGTAAQIIEDYLATFSLPALRVGTGDEIRNFISEDSFTSRNMAKINNQGLRQPPLLAASLWLNSFVKHYSGEEIIIHEGSPRSVEELTMMLSLSKAGYFGPLLTIEVHASDAECKKRLSERTILDKRADLSIDGEPGNPDINKIETKLAWWNDVRPEIIAMCKQENCYVRISNSKNLKALYMHIEKLFEKYRSK